MGVSAACLRPRKPEKNHERCHEVLMFTIAGRRVGIGEPPRRHRRGRRESSSHRGKALVDTAHGASFDAISFQSYTASKIATRVRPATGWSPRIRTDAVGHLAELFDSFSDDDFKALIAYARSVGIAAFSTPFDDEAVDFLSATAYCPCSDRVLLDSPASRSSNAWPPTKKPAILSTARPPRRDPHEALETLAARVAMKWVLLHCTSSTPARPRAST